MLNLKSIKPETNKSDKYSIQLYRYLKKNKYCRRVFYNRRSSVTGELEDFNEDNLIARAVVGYGDLDRDISGTPLSVILGGGNDKYTIFSYCLYDKSDFIDITEWFWKEYEKIGRCIIDRGHNKWLRDDEDRFIYTRNTRKCKWCGEWHERVIEKRVEIERVERWVK